jgi:hypothetical protein
VIIKQGDYTMNAYKDFITNKYDLMELQEIAWQGCANVAPSGLIYYYETNDVYNDYADDIHSIIDDYLRDMGEDRLPDSVMEHFGSLLHWKNALVWFATEIVANEVINMEELA